MILEGVIIPPEIEKMNGRLPSAILRSIGGYQGLPPTNNAYGQLVMEAASAGVYLSLTGCYRSLTEQVDLFLDRYGLERTVYGSKTYQGKTYYLKKGEATAATPGNSVHGFGLAVDFCMADGKPLTRKAINWLQTHGPSLGWRQSIDSEPWHWVLVRWALYEDDLPTIPPVELDMLPVILIETDHPDPKPQHYVTPDGLRMWIENPTKLAALRRVMFKAWGVPMDTPPIQATTEEARVLPKIPGTIDPPN